MKNKTNTWRWLMGLMLLFPIPMTAMDLAAADSTERLLPVTDTAQLVKKVLKPEEVVDTLSDTYLDTLNIQKKLMINDYSMIGIFYGGGFNAVNFMPTKKNETFFLPHQFGITYTKYGKMFNYMPYFGIQVGLLYGQDGYKFKPNDEGYTDHVDGATHTVYDYLEVPLLAHLHVDFWRMKLLINLGLYGGYRLKVNRSGPDVPEAYLHQFYDYENRWDYGFKGGLGLGFVFDPFELHINAQFRHSLSSLYEPDYSSDYFYKMAYPMNLAITVGLHFHLTKRTGKTKAQLKKEAYNTVFQPETVTNAP